MYPLPFALKNLYKTSLIKHTTHIQKEGLNCLAILYCNMLYLYIADLIWKEREMEGEIE